MEMEPEMGVAAMPEDQQQQQQQQRRRRLSILSWNVAALKALAKQTPPPLNWLRAKLEELGAPSLVCLQEHKVARDALTVDVAMVEGYFAFLAHPAKASAAYSGVVTYVKAGVKVLAAAASVGCCAFAAPQAAEDRAGSSCPFECARFRTLWEAAVLSRGKATEEEGAGSSGSNNISSSNGAEEPRALLQALDAEGRCVMTDHGAFVLVNTYCPFNNPDDPSREAFKHNWNVALRLRCEALAAAGRAVVLAGDLNAIPQAIDHPEHPPESEMRQSPWVRWMRVLLSPPLPPPSSSEEQQGEQQQQPSPSSPPPPLFIDSFRRMHPTREGAFTCWANQTGARQTNYGRRIDYILVSPQLCDGPTATLEAAEVQQQVLGSDHCPVSCSLLFPSPSPSSSSSFSSPFLPPGQVTQLQDLPPLCTATFPEFRGKQASLKGFLMPKAASSAAGAEQPPPAAAPVMMAAAAPTLAFGGSSSGGGGGASKGKGKGAGGKKRPLPSSSSSASGQPQGPKRQQQLALSHFLVRSSSSTTAASGSGVGGVGTMAVRAEAREVEVVCVDGDDDDDGDAATQQEQDQEQEQEQATEAAAASARSAASPAAAAAASQASSVAAVRESFLEAFRPQSPPKCRGHGRPMVRRQVKKAGPTQGRYFWSCVLPEGRKGDPNSRCDHFEWDTRVKGVKKGQGAGGGGKGS